MKKPSECLVERRGRDAVLGHPLAGLFGMWEMECGAEAVVRLLAETGDTWRPFAVEEIVDHPYTRAALVDLADYGWLHPVVDAPCRMLAIDPKFIERVSRRSS